MRKKLIFIVTMLATSVFAGCENTQYHEHTFDLENWEKNSSSHWHKATCEHSDLIKDMANHEFGDGDTCIICGYKLVQERSFVVSFDSNGGTNVGPVAVTNGGAIAAPEEPTKQNFVFMGWYESEDYTGNPYVFGTRITEDLELRALWGISVKFLGYNNEVYKEETIRVNTKVSKPSDPVATGLHFNNWYNNSEFVGEPFSFDQTITSGMTLYAKFCYKVTFLNSANDVYQTNYLTESEILDAPTDPTRVGHNFDGWYSEPEFNTKYVFGKTLTSDLVLYSKMDPITYNITYVNVDGLTHENPSTYTYGSNIEIKNPTADAQADASKFYGWYFDEEFTEEAEEISNTTYGDLTLYAKRGNYHTISYKGWPKGITNPNPVKFTKYDQIELEKVDFNEYPGFIEMGFQLGESFIDAIPFGVDEDIEVNVLYATKKSTITLNPNSGEMIPYKPYILIDVKVNSPIRLDLPQDGRPIDIYEATKDILPEVDDYMFAGFYKDYLYSEPLIPGEFNTLESGSTIYARYINALDDYDLPYTFPFLYSTHYELDGFEGFTNLNVKIPVFVEKVKITVETNANGNHSLMLMCNPGPVIIENASYNSNGFTYTNDEVDLTNEEYLVIKYRYNGDYDFKIKCEVVSYMETLVECAPITETETYEINYWDTPLFSDVFLNHHTFKGWYDEDGNKFETESPWAFIEGEYTFSAKLLHTGEYGDQIYHYGQYLLAFIPPETYLSSAFEDYADEIYNDAKEDLYEADSLEEMTTIVEDAKAETETIYRAIILDYFITRGEGFIQAVGGSQLTSEFNVAIEAGSAAIRDADLEDIYEVYEIHIENLEEIYKKF